ncbi:MAG TPA: dehydrogenase [Candidatus Acetothermia bacterium]|nr:dehydrogenase [Candidatus Acetothermia bacterium]
MRVRSKAPLRIGLAGGGTDVSPFSDLYGGYVLNATIDMYAYCTLERRNDNRILFHAMDLDHRFEASATPSIAIARDLPLHKAVYNRIVRDFTDGQPLPLTVTTYSDAPPGSGLGSSSTMVVAMVVAYRELLNLPLGEYDVAHLAYEIERIDAELSGGKQDQYAATFGGFNFMEFYAGDRVIVNPLRIKSEIANELEMRMILYYTGQSRESANIIKEQTRRATGRKLSSINAMNEVKQSAIKMKEHLLKGNFDSFALELGRAWQSKKQMASSITNDRINAIYEAAIASGATSGKISGAGGGGFMMFCTEPTAKLNVVKALAPFGGQTVRFHFTASSAQAWRI